MTSDVRISGVRHSQPSYDAYRQTKHFGSLNGLRFICIFAVLWHHAPVWTAISDAPQILKSGFLGVDFFFVLSGFLITTLLLREEERDGTFSLKGFYWRRSLRILPVYFLIVTALAIYFIGIKGQTELLELLPFYYLFLSNFLATDIPMLAPTWSLSVEEQYYLVWPLLLLVTPRRYILHVLIGLIALNLVAVSGVLRVIGIVPIEIGPLVIKMFTATYAPILIGSGLAIVLHNRSGFDRLRQIVGYKAAAPITFALVLIVIHFRPADVTGWPNLLIHTAMALCLASLVIREDHAMTRVLNFRPIVRVGEISYGVYLYHLIGLHIARVGLAKIGLEGDWTVFLVYTVISLLISEVSFRYYEQPFLALRHRKP